MNGRRAKFLRRASVLLARQSSTLKRTGCGAVMYPPHSARRIYQAFKRTHNLALYKKLEQLVKLPTTREDASSQQQRGRRSGRELIAESPLIAPFHTKSRRQLR